MKRYIALLLAKAAAIIADHDDGTSMCVVIPVPDDLGFPTAGKHDDDPHVTVLYVGDNHPDLIPTIEAAVSGQKPLQLSLDAEVSYFPPSESSDGMRVAKMEVSADGLEALHKTVWGALEAAGIPVSHSFPEFKPHVTLDYIEPETEYEGETPAGSWATSGVEIWGLDEPIKVPF